MLLGTYNPAAHAGVARYAAEHGWHLNADMSRIQVIPQGWQGDGILAGLGEWEEPIQFIQRPDIATKPIVDIYYMRPSLALPRITADNVAVGKQAAEHFLEGNWRNFAWFGRVNHNVARLRRTSFTQTLAQHGHKARWLGESVQFSLQSFSGENLMRKIGEELLAGPKPEAVFAFNDFDAAFIMDACHAVGLNVPDDVAILGVDNNELVVNALQPRLSSLKLDFEVIGYEGAALLDQLMDGAPPPQAMRMIAPRGVAVRESTDVTAVNHPVVRKALALMKARLHESFGVAELARAVGISARTMETNFQKELNRSVHRTLMELRLRQARHLMQTTTDTIESIAADTGFCHAPHLYREFKRWTGQTPRAWRKSFGLQES